MAFILYGPRLSNPSSTAISVWTRWNEAVTGVTLSVRRSGDSTWTLADTQDTTDSTRNYTCVHTATGLLPGTAYQYQVEGGGSTPIAHTTMTMPPDTGGQFVVYAIMDFHQGNMATSNLGINFAVIILDYVNNYFPLGIPGLILYCGDLFARVGVSTPSTTADLASVALYSNDVIFGGSVLRRLPIIYMWDDWDFGGDNSNAVNLPLYSHDPTKPGEYWDIMWRDQPRHASPSYGFVHDIAGVPIIMADSRSQKRPEYDRVAGRQLLFGNEVYYEPLNGLFGAVQHAWLRSLWPTYADRQLVIFNSSMTFRDNVDYSMPSSVSGSRDSTGVFYKAARNDAFMPAINCGYGPKRNLLVLSGDDHRNTAWSSDFRTPVEALQTTGVTRPGDSLNLPHMELKVVSGTFAPTPGETLRVFGLGNWFEFSGSGSQRSLLRLVIDSQSSGRYVNCRATYLGTWLTTQGIIPTDSLGRKGDLFFHNGLWSYYASRTQKYPPDSLPGKWPRFTKGYVDDFHGSIHAADEVARDHEGNLRDASDLGNPGRDELNRRHKGRTEKGVDWL